MIEPVEAAKVAGAPVDIAIDAGRIIAIDPHDSARTKGDEGALVIDVTDLYVAPGFIDLQCNGALGIDVTMQPERIWELASVLPRWGVTSFLPTIISSPLPMIERARRVVSDPPDQQTGARVLGLHVEGPFLNPTRAGAHPARHLRLPKPDDVASWSKDSGIALVTLAPELDTDHEVVRALISRGVVVSAGHTNATSQELDLAISAGVSMVTHLFNAMSPLTHREPNVVGHALGDARIAATVIVDGIHVAAEVVRLAYRLLGSDRFILVSDAVAALGLPSQSLRLGDVDLIVTNDRVTTPDGILAGSILSMDQAIRNLSDFTDCSWASALRCATSTPAAAIHRPDLGTLSVGAFADVVVLDSQRQVVLTMVNGEIVFSQLESGG